MNKPLYERQKQGRRSKSDNYQTPAYALEPLIPWIPKEWTIWECACGDELLADELATLGFGTIRTDIIPRGYSFGPRDFLSYEPGNDYDVIVTNPPYSLKDEFIARCYELGKPWALLMKITALEGKKRQAMYRKHGLQMIFMDKRVNYITPHGGNSGAWFASSWFTWGLNLPSDMIFAKATW